MRLKFIMHPVDDVRLAAAAYRDVFPVADEWWPDDRTVLLTPAGAPAVMLEDDPAERDLGPGGVFLVDNVDGLYERFHGTFGFRIRPSDIPPGRYAAYVDAWGNPLRLFDLTNQAFRDRHRFE